MINYIAHTVILKSNLKDKLKWLQIPLILIRSVDDKIFRQLTDICTMS